MTNPMNKPAPAPPPPGYRSPAPPNPRNYVWVGAAILAGLAGGFTAVFLVIIGPAIDEPPDTHLSGRTVGLVERAISHYERNGLASTVDHYTAEFQRQRGRRYLILLDDGRPLLEAPLRAASRRNRLRLRLPRQRHRVDLVVTVKNLLRAVVAGLLLAGCAVMPAELRHRQNDLPATTVRQRMRGVRRDPRRGLR